MAILTGQTVANSYNMLLTLATGSISSSPQVIEDGLGGDTSLSLSDSGVTSTGTLTVDGVSTLTGAVTATGGVVGDLTGTATVATKATTVVVVDESSNSTCFPLFTTQTTGNLSVKTGTNLAFNSVSGLLTATGFSGAFFTGDVTGDVTGDITGNVTAASVLDNGVTATTQPSGTDNTTVATTAFAVALSHVPAGAITQYGAASAPTGWLLCDGAAVSRTTYSALFAIVATTYGVGDGSSTFNLPDLQGNVAVGKDGETFTDIGDTGGVEEHPLTTAEMPAHGHAVNFRFESNLVLVDSSLETTVAGGNKVDHLTQDTTISTDTGPTGGDPVEAHTNLQPYLVLNYIIKT